MNQPVTVGMVLLFVLLVACAAIATRVWIAFGDWLHRDRRTLDQQARDKWLLKHPEALEDD